MEHLNKSKYTAISSQEAEALLKAHNCIRDGWGDCDVWVAHEGALEKEIVVQDLRTKRWFKKKPLRTTRAPAHS